MNKIKQRLIAFFKGRNCPAAATALLVALSVVVLNLIFYTIGSSVPMYLRFADELDLSIGSSADDTFADAMERGDKVTVTFCMYRDVIESHTTGKYVLDTAEQFADQYPGLITLRFINILTQLDENGAPVDITPYEEYTETYGSALSRYSVIFECGNKLRIVTDTTSSVGYADFFTFDSTDSATSYSGEETFAAMVNYVVRPGETKAAYITTGHSEQPSTALINLLVRAGYNVKEINLRKAEKVPDDAGLVVISNPITDFERAAEGSGLHSEIERLREYAERGGNIFVTLDPIASRTAVLESFLSEFGFSIDRTEGESNIVKDVSDSISTDGFRLVLDIPEDGSAASIKEKVAIGGGDVILYYAASMTLTGSAKPLLVASGAETEAGGETVGRDSTYAVAGYSEHTFDNGNTASVVVVPSIYLAASDAIVSNGYANKDFIYALCEEFFEAGAMSYGIRGYVYNDNILENLTMGTARAFTAAIIAVPVLLAAVGTVVVVRRKNR